MQVATRTVCLEVQDNGPRSSPVALLIMGLGMQLTAWPQAFVDALVGDGLRVIRFDNRDIGLSQAFDHAKARAIPWAIARRMLRLPVRPPYSLDAMSDDAVALLDALGIERAHLCGVSMGGMIAQIVAIRHPQRVASLTLAMTSSGARDLPWPRPAAARALLRRPRGRDAEALVAYGVRLMRAIGSPGFPTPEAELSLQIRRWFERSYRPQGVARQLLAIAAASDRTPRLAGLPMPVHIIHGLDDPLVPIEHGRQLARAIPRANADFVAGVGHDLPEAVWQRLRRAVVGFASASTSTSASGPR
ncbi:MAG TPA: alpha/beta hydrolase [Burkholderiaceae bacterium]|nr:alpha/beta hydrolase [Burkholderiaceae bacterium]